jgi:hypothetical protein
VEGWLGVGTWTLTFEQDARYLGEHARAHRLVRAFEDLVDDGEPLHGLELDPRSPLRVPPGGAVPVLYVRGFRAGARRVVAAGNDYPLPVYARLRWPGLEPGGAYLLVDEANRLVVTGDSGTLDAEALAAGVPLRLEPKQWHFLELREVDGAGALDGFARQTPASLEAALAHDLPRLRAFATAAEGA